MQIEGTFYQFGNYDEHRKFTFNPDKVLNPYTWKLPVKWSGIVGGIKCEFVQLSNDPSPGQFDFSTFPDKCISAIPKIEGEVRNALRYLD